MELPEFIELRRPRWEALERLLERSERQGLKALALDDARALSRLYRQASSDLLWVRSRAGAADVSGYLNDLVGRAYAMTYPGQRIRPREVLRFLTHGFPELVKYEWRLIAASTLMFLVGGGFGWIGMAFDPDAAPYLVPTMHQKLDPTERVKNEADTSKQKADVGDQAAFSAFLMRNNIGVAFFAFALGLTAGVGTTILLFGNGVLLGSLAWVYAAKGQAAWFWAWILPHGIPEITAICLAGAAGLVLARAMVAPRGLARRVALRREGVTAVKLVLGTVVLFILAGFIEGTISQIHPPRLPIWFKITFALVVGSGVYAYLLSAFLRRADPTVTSTAR